MGCRCYHLSRVSLLTAHNWTKRLTWRREYHHWTIDMRITFPRWMICNSHWYMPVERYESGEDTQVAMYPSNQLQIFFKLMAVPSNLRTIYINWNGARVKHLSHVTLPKYAWRACTPVYSPEESCWKKLFLSTRQRTMSLYRIVPVPSLSIVDEHPIDVKWIF